MSTENNKKNPFQDTLNLPKTDFSIRANAVEKESEILKNWENKKLSVTSFTHNIGKEKFILHDGPPYANGNIHLGHVLNKTLKDISAKYKRMLGFHVPVTPGWDCHGLPIELKVTKEKEKELNAITDPLERRLILKKYSREYVNKWINTQREEFKNLGVLMNWDNPYITMSPEYESSILKAFSKFVEGGFIERKNKTVPWCASCKTVLATAEIEYKDRKDPSIYVLFELDKSSVSKLFSNYEGKQVNFLIWTTTPWTLPLNRAVVLNSNAKYSLLDINDNKTIIVASDLADKLCKQLEIEKIVLQEFESQILKNSLAIHPFIDNLQVPVILDNSVLLNEGTACVHSAPGCGPEDYALGVKNNLEIYSPLSIDGKYTAEIEPKELVDMPISNGQIWVLRKLQEVGRLLYKTNVTHSYPHCWRCHNGLMFRATEQWFCNLQKNNLIEKTLSEIEKIKFYPDWGKNRLYAFVSNRTEWCISRQRTWGVPITAIICAGCGHAYLDKNFIDSIANFVEKEGIEFWDRVTIKELVDLKILPKTFSCASCHNNTPDKFKKETDILDVWFDSGVSSYAVLQQNLKDLAFPADLYLEGSDQHRGWFQSSLLSSMVLNNKSQAKTIVTHGFTVDEKGYKMSKSLGNVIAPDEIIKKYSRDILRLFVASVDYQNDIVVSDNALNNVMQAYKKIRNTCRFMLSNLYDFDIKKDTVTYENLLLVDQYILNKLYDLNEKILESYENYNFASVFHLLNSFCANDLSALYLDISKDRLYTESANGLLRRSAQTAIYIILDTITHLMAPILSFLAEEVSDFYMADKKESIHLCSIKKLIDIWDKLKNNNKLAFESALKAKNVNENLDSLTYKSSMIGAFNALESLREVVLKAIEEKRKLDIVKHSLEAKVTVYFDKDSREFETIKFLENNLDESENLNKFLKDWLIVSQLEFATKNNGLDATELPWVFVRIEHAIGDKCPRCWQWEATDHAEKLCKRCALVLKK